LLIIKNQKKMKQNYKISLYALLLVWAVGMMTAKTQAATLAVLVVGLETDAASDAFATGIRYEFTQKGYELATNNAVAAKLKELRDKHAEGKTVDIVGLAAWGKENGLDFVQLVVESDCSITIGNSAPVNGREQVAQVVNCGTAKYSGRGYYRTRFVPNLNPGAGFEEMVFVVGGVFEMGCKSGRDGTCRSDETLHWVKVNNFYIGKYTVTQALWKKVMGDLPSDLKSNSTYLGDDKPVIYVNYDDIVGTNGFLAKLNAQTGKTYRLPTEAEWEYAARGCNGDVCETFTYSGSNTIGNVAYYGNSSGGPARVGTKLPNALGLYDMSGNVWEWCSDWYDSYGSSTQSSPLVNPTGPSNGSRRMHRGGCWNTIYGTEYWCRNAYRTTDLPSAKLDYLGFRLVLP
jgi:formylglycine-generating enzyme required for sulfatase activity